MSIGKRIKEKREALGMSQEELANRIGYVSRSSINKIEADERNLTQSKIKQIADALMTTPSYIMGWDSSIKEQGKVPLIGSIACGTPITAIENVSEMIILPDGVRAEFCLTCKGDSMIDARIEDGDTVFIRQQPTVENGEIAAVLIDDEATLKRVNMSDDAIVLLPANKKYAPMVYIGSDMDKVRILGKAVAFLSKIER